MGNLVIQPCGKGDPEIHYQDTVRTYVPLSRIRQHLEDRNKDEMKRLEEIYPDGQCQVWGVTPGKTRVNVSKWRQLMDGDIALFSAKKYFFSRAIITHMIHDKRLSLHLWGTKSDGQTWEYIYFIKDVKPIRIHYDTLNRAVGYSIGNNFMGFQVINSNHGSVQSFIGENNLKFSNGSQSQVESRQEVEQEDAVQVQEEFDNRSFPEGETNYVMHIKRERNAALIREVKEDYLDKDENMPCMVCGFSFKQVYGEVGGGFIEAHHTVPLSEYSGSSETRPEDIILVCSNCHRMLHRKRPWLTVEEVQSLLTS